MNQEMFKVNKNNTIIEGTGVRFNEEDIDTLISIYYGWKNLNNLNIALGIRRINFPESVSEGFSCILFDILRTNNVSSMHGIKHTSMDAINPSNGITYQIKACSTTSQVSRSANGSPTSFGPRSEWDKLLYIHIDCDKDIMYFYEYEDNINNVMVNRKETFADQCAQGRRPRFNMLPAAKKTKPILIFSLKERKIIND